MSAIEPWPVIACQNCGLPFGICRDCPNDRDGWHIESGGIVQVVPAGEAERLREWLRYIEATTEDMNVRAAVELALQGDAVEWGQS